MERDLRATAAPGSDPSEVQPNAPSSSPPFPSCNGHPLAILGRAKMTMAMCLVTPRDGRGPNGQSVQSGLLRRALRVPWKPVILDACDSNAGDRHRACSCPGWCASP